VKNLLVIMGKEPVPGAVKTRLQPRLSEQEAAALYRCLLLDRIEAVRDLPDIDRAIAFFPPSARSWFSRMAPEDFALFPQRGKDLSSRLADIVTARLNGRPEALSIIDSDSPDLPPPLVQESFRRLHSGADVVFGPCADGGYYLVGMREAHPLLFEGIPWSTAEVLQASLAKASSLGLKTALLPPWRDIDTFDDLQAFYRRPADSSPGAPAPGRHTRAYVNRLAEGGKKDLGRDPSPGSSR
jgi:rSAM/selenodomain-associated transferase 1